MALNTETTLVGMLRQRTVEEDLKQYLKTTMGGYTKKSVTEYMRILREQQIKYAETFNRNIQAIFEEKEALKKENERLQLKNTQIETEYCALAESLKINEMNDPEAEVQDALSLRNSCSALEAENRDLKYAQRQHLARLERMTEEASVRQTELEKSRQETKSLSELLALEKRETNKQRELVASYSGIIEELQEETLRYKQVLSEGEFTRLGIKISELMANATLKEEIIERYKNELEQKDDEVVMLTEENEALCRSVDQVNSALKSMTVQNEKLMSANNALAASLEAENKRIIRLLNEKSEQTVEKLIAARKLEEMSMKLSLMKMLPDKTADTSDTAGTSDITNLSVMETMPAS